MDTSWWLALAAVVLLALVATLVDGWGRAPRRQGNRHMRHANGPQPSEIWWADEHPCLVLTVHGGYVTVANISSKFRDGRSGVIPLPPGAVGDAHGRTSFVETDDLRQLPVADLRRRVGVVDPALWDQVRHLT
ncbi:type II toxin-antitoxin system PemK/MazF family toxin [Streptomyces niveiscabiei]|uniref:type II toxin-antitoxin system PemK/MazF family toxin n=1 Tax=Streptomyces niveiscabiei TaxID=164115 RepID=UPI0029AA97A4|nr:type II toxin-antitoxin system PemK/MazF family toxin [Streptomyces niveiscabiei]MDX3388115.1 type II toxin-antitoxin system PemK/MazF family toxin [Streptomyces niveiscabiei]